MPRFGGVKDDDFGWSDFEFGWSTAGLFIFVFIRYVGGITGYIFK